jgi:hypothetical protein
MSYCDCTFHKNIILNMDAYFSKIFCHTSFQDTEVSGSRVTATSQVYASTVLLLTIVGNKKVWQWDGIQ